MVQFRKNRRVFRDRRQEPTRPSIKYLFSGRRQTIRRESDRKSYLYVDRYGHNLLIALLLIILLCVFDAYFTLFHVEEGAREINPFMSFLIGYGKIHFFAAKYTLTALGIFLLCLYKNLFVVRIIIASVLLLYLTVVTHHVLLILTK